MKTELEKCSKCGEETLHDIRKVISGERSGKHYIRRTVTRCRECGTKEINNRNTGKRVISGKNKTATIKDASLEVKDGR